MQRQPSEKGVAAFQNRRQEHRRPRTDGHRRPHPLGGRMSQIFG